MEKKNHLSSFLTGLLKENPLLVMLLGTCPALAVTTSLESALGMGMLFTFVLVASNVIISLLRKIIPEEIHIPAYIAIIATFVTLVKMFSEAYLPELYNSLGVFISLLVVNCIVLGRAESFASKNGVLDSFLDGAGNGLGYTWAISAIAIVREILGTGKLTFGSVFTFIPKASLPILKGEGYDFSMSLFTNPAGGFIVFGIAIAIMAAIKNYRKRVEAEKKAAEKKEAK